jgi:hypothetical protein
MLYRKPRFSPVSVVRAGLTRLVSLATEMYRTNADTAHIDGLNDAALRDLGIRRIETRDDRFYR